MTDIVNTYFKHFYPASLDEEKFEFSDMLGGMRHYRNYSVSTIFPRMECADGFSMSVQGHAGAYSRPRDDFADNYSMVEVGFPSEREELLMPYVEDANNPTETVYGYVPIKVVVAVVEKHGGLAPTPTNNGRLMNQELEKGTNELVIRICNIFTSELSDEFQAILYPLCSIAISLKKVAIEANEATSNIRFEK